MGPRRKSSTQLEHLALARTLRHNVVGADPLRRMRRRAAQGAAPAAAAAHGDGLALVPGVVAPLAEAEALLIMYFMGKGWCPAA